jgi:hypothetical protein
MNKTFFVERSFTKTEDLTRSLESLVEFINKGFEMNEVSIKATVEESNGIFGNYKFTFMCYPVHPSKTNPPQ